MCETDRTVLEIPVASDPVVYSDPSHCPRTQNRKCRFAAHLGFRGTGEVVVVSAGFVNSLRQGVSFFPRSAY